ncbi:hypothetical protein GCK72_018860 [Caenorhabditis remanei]|uniref:Uncharacterized protein n=1 Tax=Caenorhabditis remanei TaxID=31234 RepID=A0A6A5GBR3_CAERE|nr:hypothetical protein GCK72_018860 [Caenorhabditis remanei]KAF1752306.1 hypothetical protein GCK72_018860 [Caenorhabditis remanei]
MPKDKKSKEGKKAGSSGQEVEIVVKRKSSIVDSSGGSSSSSSDNSGNSSDHSQSGDSDGSIGFDNEKGTMTNDSQEGTSSSSLEPQCYVTIRDRTDEMHRLINNHVQKSTHFVPIQNNTPNKDEPSTSASINVAQLPPPVPLVPQVAQIVQIVQQAVNSKPATIAKPIKNNGKQKQLTKKQKKAEKKAKENYPGQKEQRAKVPLEFILNSTESGDEDRISQVNRAVRAVQATDGQPNLHVHHFDERDCTGDSVQDGEMVNRVTMPFYRREEDLGQLVHFTDLHKNSQMRYLRHVHSLGKYMELPPNIKLLHRMGYGISASGCPDPEPLKLTINGAKPFMKHTYSDYVMSCGKVTNWRSEFAAHIDMDGTVRPHEYEEVQIQLRNAIQQMINSITDDFERGTLIDLRDRDLKYVLLRFGEMERSIMRNENKFQNRVDGRRFSNESRQTRIACLSNLTLASGTRYYLEKFEDNICENRAVSILMHLASTAKSEKPCYADKHRKCAVLHFLLQTSNDKEKYLTQKFSGGNTLLHFAAMTGSPCQIDTLLRHGAALNELNDLFKSPVSLAVRRHCNLVARQLMWHGADIGGCLSLIHIHPRTPRETANKELSDYQDFCASIIPYKAREFLSLRLRALTNTFCSWVEALLIDAEARIPLTVHSVKSSLHQIRIGRDVMDPMIEVGGKVYVKKTLHMTIEKGEFTDEPIALFLLPCQYTKFDTTMGAGNPHIIRIAMVTDAVSISNNIAEKEKIRLANGLPRVEYKDDFKNCRPIKLLGESVAISFGDTCVDRYENLESFFSYEHNGCIYAYNLPKTVTHNENRFTNITIRLTLSESECNRFKDSFFMVQALQIVSRSQEPNVFNAGETSFSNPIDPRAEAVAEQVAVRKAELIAAEAHRVKEAEMKDKLRENRVRGMVSEIQSGVALRKSQKESEAAASTSQKVSASASTSTCVIYDDPDSERSLNKKKNE